MSTKPWKKFQRKPKQKKALWVACFPDQAKALHPELSPSGGIRGQSGSAKVRAEVYGAIAKVFKRVEENKFCLACYLRDLPRLNKTDDIHHKRGRSGLLLFDVRYFVPVCRSCHQWLGANIKEAEAFGLIEPKYWGKQ